MPIELTPVNHAPLMQGHTWKVADEQLLAELIARVALGQSRHVSKILLAAGGLLPLPVNDPWSGAEDLLTVPTGQDPYHRDGWMFQVMSWMAAQKAAPNSLINAPHMIHAQKGFDGLRIDFDLTSAVCAVVIFEDKATINPRETITREVWPALQNIESGESASVLVSEVTALLEKRSGIDVDSVVRQIIWKEARHFRVSVTVCDSHKSDEGRMRLFKGYESAVSGDNVMRRRGETFYVAVLRDWMNDIADRGLAHIAALKSAHV